METGRISERQLAYLMTTILLSTVIYFMPQLASRAVEQDGWITALIATVWGILNTLVILALSRRFPGKTFIEFLPIILGKPLGKILGAFYAFWFIGTGAFIMREFGVFLNTTIMPSTPVAVFILTLAILVFYSLRSGLEAWVRVNDIILPIVVLAVVAVIVFPFKHMDLHRLLPVLNHSWGTLIVSSFVSASFRGEILLAAMFLPALAAVNRTGRNLLLVTVFIGIILAAMEVAAVAVFGGVCTGQMELPAFSLARMISFAKVFDRVEALTVVGWIMGNFVKTSAFIYCATVATAQVLGFKEFQFLVFPVTVLILALSDNFLQSVAQFTDFLTHVWPGYALWSFEMVIPLILLLIAVLRFREKSGAS